MSENFDSEIERHFCGAILEDKAMSTPVIPESDKQRRCRHASIVRTTDNMKADPWWWECDACEKQFVDRELLGTAESLIREQVKLLQEVLSLVDESEHDKRAPEYLRQQVMGIVANKIRKALSRVPKELQSR